MAGRAAVIAFLVAANQAASRLAVACPAPTPSCGAITSIGLVARIVVHMLCHCAVVSPPAVLRNGEITTGLPGLRACRWSAAERAAPPRRSSWTGRRARTGRRQSGPGCRPSTAGRAGPCRPVRGIRAPGPRRPGSRCRRGRAAGTTRRNAEWRRTWPHRRGPRRPAGPMTRDKTARTRRMTIRSRDGTGLPGPRRPAPRPRRARPGVSVRRTGPAGSRRGRRPPSAGAAPGRASRPRPR